MNIVKMYILPKAIYRQCSPYQNLKDIFYVHRIKKKFLKFRNFFVSNSYDFTPNGKYSLPLKKETSSSFVNTSVYL